MRRGLALVAMAGLLVAAAVYNVRARQGARPSPLPPTSDDERAVATTVPLRPAPRFQEVKLIGFATSMATASISPKVPARIVTVEVQNGDAVTAGQTLARLDFGDTAAQMRGLVAAVDAAKAQFRKAESGRSARRAEMDSAVAEARSGLALARTKLEQALAGESLASLQAVSDREQTELEVRAARAGLAKAEAGHSQALEVLKRTKFLFDRGGVSRAEMEGAETQLRVADGQLEEARSGLERAKKGSVSASKSAPLRDRVSAADTAAAREGLRYAEEGLASAMQAREAALRVARADLDSARAAVRQAVEGLNQARAQIGGAVLSSPIGGIVTERNGNPGDYAQPGFPVMRVIDSTRLRADFALPVALAGAVGAGAPIRIRRAGASREMSGSVIGIERVAAPDARTVAVSVSLPKSGRLTPGEPLTGILRLRLPGDARLVPLDAVDGPPGSESLFVARGERATAIRVRVLAEIGEVAVVTGAFRTGDRAIRSADRPLREGMRALTREP